MGLVFSSINDLPPSMRQQVAGKLIAAVRVNAEAAMPSKHHNIKVKTETHTFDSQKEYRRFLVLMEAQRYGIICDLRLQQNFTLIEGFTKPDGERVRPVVYKADFTYQVANKESPDVWRFSPEDVAFWKKANPCELIIEDVKSEGTRTRVYINKYKMMAEKGYHVREV